MHRFFALMFKFAVTAFCYGSIDNIYYVVIYGLAESQAFLSRSDEAI